MNFIDGQITASGFQAGNLTLPIKEAPAGSAGRPARYGIRPEHLRLTGDGIPVEVIVTEPTGSETQVVGKLEGQEITCVFRERITATPREIIRVAPEVSNVHLFDERSGQRL